MRKVTQAAVWHFTDGMYNTYGQLQSYSDAEALALSILLTKAGSTTLKPSTLNYYLTEYKKLMKITKFQKALKCRKMQP